MTRTTDRAVLLPYSGDALCPKCAADGVKMRWCDATFDKRLMGERRHFEVEEGIEHFHRRCQRCGYAWLEALP